MTLAAHLAFEEFRRQLDAVLQQFRVALPRATPTHPGQQQQVDSRVLALSNQERKRRLRGVAKGVLAGKTLRCFAGLRLLAFLQLLAESVSPCEPLGDATTSAPSANGNCDSSIPTPGRHARGHYKPPVLRLDALPGSHVLGVEFLVGQLVDGTERAPVRRQCCTMVQHP